jgi:hypothetical protein
VKRFLIVNSKNPLWQNEALALMASNQNFVVENWDHEFDANALLKESNYKFRASAKTTVAFFEPKTPN